MDPLANIPVVDLVRQARTDEKIRELLTDEKFWHRRLVDEFKLTPEFVATKKNPRLTYWDMLLDKLLKEEEYFEVGRAVCLSPIKLAGITKYPRLKHELNFNSFLVGLLVEGCDKKAIEYIKGRYHRVEDEKATVLNVSVLLYLHQGDAKSFEETLSQVLERVSGTEPLRTLYEEARSEGLIDPYPRSPEMIDNALRLNLATPGEMVGDLLEYLEDLGPAYSLLKYLLTRYGKDLSDEDVLSSHQETMKRRAEMEKRIEQIETEEKEGVKFLIFKGDKKFYLRQAHKFQLIADLLESMIMQREESRLAKLLLFFHEEGKEKSPERKIFQLPLLDRVSSREELNKRLKEFCHNENLGISLEALDDIPYEELRNVRLFHGTCFNLRDLWAWVKERVESNLPVRHPYTNKPIIGEEIKALEREYHRYIDPEAELKSPEIKFDEKTVFFQVSEPFLPEGVDVPFYHLEVVTPFETIDLGYIPEFTDPTDLWTSSEAILTNLRILWDKRRLLTVHYPTEEISCCSVHLQKPISYWLLPDGRVNRELVAKMAEEIRDRL
jgi:hypothetical protein